MISLILLPLLPIIFALIFSAEGTGLNRRIVIHTNDSNPKRARRNKTIAYITAVWVAVTSFIAYGFNNDDGFGMRGVINYLIIILAVSAFMFFTRAFNKRK